MKQRGLLDRMGGRKFIVVQQAVLFSFVLGLRGQLTAEWSGVVSLCVIAFAAGDTILTRAAINKGVSVPSSPKQSVEDV